MTIDPVMGILKDDIGYLVYTKNIVCGVHTKFFTSKKWDCYTIGNRMADVSAEDIEKALKTKNIIWRRESDKKTKRPRRYSD